ncbi:hypothetical protein CpB0742 [Chlamydia pneumoniae TW-183]|uniref:Uncharacterized protein n=1 Tax=Chlamydia pneumoniae TaxID=83558 RepID=A0ABN3YQT2_CHLPN|nr:hypothetical protein CpB0742 [Chlamydia pneumoniae TW-183]
MLIYFAPRKGTSSTYKFRTKTKLMDLSLGNVSLSHELSFKLHIHPLKSYHLRTESLELPEELKTHLTRTSFS